MALGNGLGNGLGSGFWVIMVFFYPNLILQWCLEFKSHVLVGGGGGGGWRFHGEQPTASVGKGGR